MIPQNSVDLDLVFDNQQTMEAKLQTSIIAMKPHNPKRMNVCM